MAKQDLQIKKNSIAKSSVRPIVIINFKTYKEATGPNAILLAVACERAAKKYEVDIRLAVQATDLATVARAVTLPVYAQHVDSNNSGQSTGWVTIAAIKAAGAKGSLINHVEHRLDKSTILNTAKLLQKEKLDAIVCVEHVRRLQDLKDVTATLLCIEPPELIGGNISITNAKPKIIKDAVAATKKPVLIGAGVKTHEDLVTALKFGCNGILVASGVVLAKNKEQALKDLLQE